MDTLRVSAGKTSRIGRTRSVRPFLLRFVGLLVLFYTAYTTSFESRPVQLHLEVIAHVARLMLLPFYDARVFGNLLDTSHGDFTMIIGVGCDAAYPLACFVAGVLAFSAPCRDKIVGLVAGVTLIEILNLIRIVTLFIIGIHFHRYFDLFHTQIWEGLFVLLALLLWMAWAMRVVRKTP